MSNNNNDHLDDPAFEELFFSMFPQMQNTNWQDNSIECFPMSPWNNNTAVEVPPVQNQSLLFYNDWNNTELQNQVNVIPTNHVPPPAEPNIIADIQPNHIDQSLMFQNGWNNTQFLDGSNDHVPLPALLVEVADTVYPQDYNVFYVNNMKFHNSLELPSSQANPVRSRNRTSALSKKCQRWTKEEHRLFLEGLRIYGKGNWTKISKDIIKTKTNLQVASHAQKHFLHRCSSNKKKKRRSIHDMAL